MAEVNRFDGTGPMSQKVVKRMRVEGADCRVTITVDFATSDHAARFMSADGKRAMGAVRTNLASIARGDPDRSRDRSGELQPQLPRQLRDKLKAAARDANTTGTDLINRWLSRYIDFETGARRRDKKGKIRLPGPLRDFQERGRKLHSMGDRVRLTFDAGDQESKEAIERLMRGTKMKLSQFFTALIDRGLEAGDGASTRS